MQDTFLRNKSTLNFGGKLELITNPKVMGILNTTPDSFYDGGSNNSLDLALENVNKMLTTGADIIDLGSYSSRPGATHISEQEEIDRMLPVLTKILQDFPDVIVSIDTFRAKVAEVALEAGAKMINDISGGNIEPDIWDVVAKYHVPYVAMHMPGTPQTMQNDPIGENVTEKVISFFAEQIEKMKTAGIKDIIIDPGFGFGKTLQSNYSLLKNLHALHILELPILVGVSRKSMIQKLVNTDAQNALNGPTAVHMLALQQGASFLRVHDVKEAVEAIKIWETFRDSE